MKYYEFNIKCIKFAPIYYVKLVTGGNNPTLTNSQKYSMIVQKKNR